MTIFTVFRSISGIAVLLAGLASAAAMAAPRNESAATAAGLALVEAAASGRVDEAFKSAATLGRANDSALAIALDVQQRALTPASISLGASRGPVRLQPIEATIFSGCINREYRAVYAGGEQRWRLKFRRGAGGWALADLAVISEPSS
ncbi:hypothetical protein [Nevskia ramosa]|uniref:hypothetical protein n=1 Tax=Nevskia ramosa TaxID=64002 RepID=UPI0003B49C28|nr:hypothetical protein [Nevskia ramosa]